MPIFAIQIEYSPIAIIRHLLNYPSESKWHPGMSKKIYKHFLLCFLLALCCNIRPAGAQDVDFTGLLESGIESEDQNELIEYLQTLIERPLNINTSSARQLETLPWLSSTQSRRIVQFRQTRGGFRSLDELLNVPGLTPEFLDILRPFLTVQRSEEMGLHLNGRQRFFSKLNGQENNTKYLGSSQKLYNRLDTFLGQSVRLGILTEKDAGERTFNDLQIGYAHLASKKLKTSVLLGHYIAEFGQGLVFWGPYRLHKGYDPIAPAKARSRGLRPYRSVDENAPFYGGGISGAFGVAEWSLFYSRSRLDANTIQDTVRSLVRDGYHRTVAEIAKKDNLCEQLVGMNVNIGIKRLAVVGVSVQSTRFDKTFPPRSSLPDRYAFVGRRNSVAGLHWDFTFGALNLFGEAARSASGGRAVMAGCWLDVTKFDAVLVWRHYAPDFQNQHGYGFGNRGQTLNNEKGFYFGWRYKLTSRLKVFYFLDNVAYPWPMSRTPMPSSEYQSLAMIEQKISKNVKLQAGIKVRSRQCSQLSADNFGNAREKIARHTRSSYRLQMDANFGRALRLRTRLEANRSSDMAFVVGKVRSMQTGVLLYQDVMYRANKRASLLTRWCFFDAPDYKVRFYIFENDMPGVMRLKMLYGRGTRWYAMIAYNALPMFKIHLKYEHTWYDMRTGNRFSPDNHETAFSLQIDWKL